MADTPMNVYFGGKKATIPSSAGGSLSIDLSNYVTQDELESASEGLLDSVIERLHDMAKDTDMDFVRIYNDTRTDRESTTDPSSTVIDGDGEVDDNL